MKISEVTSEPKAQHMPNGVVQNNRFKFETYEIKTAKDTQELVEVLAEGVSILLNLQNADSNYVIIQKVIPVKLAFTGEVGKKNL